MYACLYMYMHILCRPGNSNGISYGTQCNTTLCVVDIIINTAMAVHCNNHTVKPSI